ncbi:MAG: hypothetical protein KBF96_01250 [Ignavibacteria bacterium]|jgi:long-subunit fatty acid transport protein|nr:hypothetical protein [Ignavibacteria bacterium]
MKKIKNIILVLILTSFFVTGKGFSQELITSGSPYSVFGIGDQTYFTSVRTFSMGIQGIALFGNYINTLNPATLTKMRSTLISVTGNYGFLKSANSISENNISGGNFLGFNIGIPFDQTRGWVLSLGFNPQSLMNYKVKVIGNTGYQQFNQFYTGKGGLSRINIGMSYNLLGMISMGFEYDYSFGELKQQNFINFNNAGYTNTNIKSEIDFRKSFLKGGMIFEMGKIFRSFTLRDLNLGFVFQSGINLNATQDGIFGTSLGADTINLNNGTLNVPDQYGIGLTNTFNNKYLVSADVLYQDWSKYTEFGVTYPQLKESYRAGLGLEILPTENKPGFFQTMTYRIGGFYENGNIKISGQDINSYGFRAGVNIPLSNFNSIDLGVNYSVRGTDENNLIQDEYLNFTMGVNFGELWFIRPKEEDQ